MNISIDWKSSLVRRYRSWWRWLKRPIRKIRDWIFRLKSSEGKTVWPKLREAKAVLEQRAKERYEQERVEYEAKMKVRQEKEKEGGKKPRGRQPKPPQEGPNPKDQYNFTDPESRIMKTANGFDQCYNAQAAVTEEMLIVGAYANAHCNDKEELLPVLDSIPGELGKVDTAAADTGYFSENNVKGAQNREVEP